MASALALVREIYVMSYDNGIRKAVHPPSRRAAVSCEKSVESRSWELLHCVGETLLRGV